MTAPAIQISQVEQGFRTGFWMKRAGVLHGVTFDVAAGSIFGFLGENGAGKTTLIHLIAGIRQPLSGTVKVLGHESHTKDARARIGYLPERPYFHEHLTGENFLRYFGALSGMERGLIEKRIPEVLCEVGLEEAARRELRRYSKGMLQRIGIAQALLHDPKVLILDEPMSGLDPHGRKEMRELIVRLAGGDRTVFFSTHVIPDVEAICDQIAVIRQGRLVGCGPIGRFLAQGPLQTEIGFAGAGEEVLGTVDGILSRRTMPDGIRITVSGQAAVAAALSRLLEARARILWVTPLRPSLESLFEVKP